MNVLYVIIAVLSVALAVMIHREFTWRVRGRNRNAIAYMVARIGDTGEEYRGTSGAWSVKSGAVYMKKTEAIIASTGLDSAYLVPLRLDPRARIERDKYEDPHSELWKTVENARVQSRPVSAGKG